MINRIKTRARRIQSSKIWLNFIDSCYSLTCVNMDHNWMTINGLKQCFTEGMSRIEEQPGYFRFENEKFIDPIFCTVFDTKNKRGLL